MKDESTMELESLKKKMRKQEEDMNREIQEANDAAEVQRIDAENQIEKLVQKYNEPFVSFWSKLVNKSLLFDRLETKIMKTEEKARKAKEQNQQLNEKLDEKSQEVRDEKSLL